MFRIVDQYGRELENGFRTRQEAEDYIPTIKKYLPWADPEVIEE